MAMEIFRKGNETEVAAWLENHATEVSVSCSGITYVANLQLAEIVHTLQERQQLPNASISSKIRDLNSIGQAALLKKEQSCLYFLILKICSLWHALLVCLRCASPLIDINIESTINGWTPRAAPSPTASSDSSPAPSVVPPLVESVILAIKQKKVITKADYDLLVEQLPERINLKEWHFPIEIHNPGISKSVIDFNQFRRDIDYDSKLQKYRTRSCTLVFPVATKNDRALLAVELHELFRHPQSQIACEIEEPPLLDNRDLWNIHFLFYRFSHEQKRRFFAMHFAEGAKDPKILANFQQFTKNAFDLSVPYLAENFHHICSPHGSISPQWDLRKIYESSFMGTPNRIRLYAICEHLLVQENLNDNHLLAVMKLIGYEEAQQYRSEYPLDRFVLPLSDTFFEKALFLRQNNKHFVYAVLNEIMTSTSIHSRWFDAFFILQAPRAFTDYISSFFATTLTPDARFSKVKQLLIQPGLDVGRIQEILTISGFTDVEVGKRLKAEQEAAKEQAAKEVAAEADPRRKAEEILNKMLMVLDLYAFFENESDGLLAREELAGAELEQIAGKIDGKLKEASTSWKEFLRALIDICTETEFKNIYKILLHLKKDKELEVLYFHSLTDRYLQHQDHCKATKKMAVIFTHFWTLDTTQQSAMIASLHDKFKYPLSWNTEISRAVPTLVQRSGMWRYCLENPSRFQVLYDMALAIPLLERLELTPTRIFEMSFASIEGFIKAAVQENQLRLTHFENKSETWRRKKEDRFDDPKHPIRNVLTNLRTFIQRIVPISQAVGCGKNPSLLIIDYMREHSEWWVSSEGTLTVDIEVLLAVAPLLRDIEALPTTELMPRLKSIYETHEKVLHART